MLVLTRRDGETIHIGDDVEITVVECHRDAVRIGISAPRSMSIKRGELVDPDMVPKVKEFKRARLEREAAERQAEETEQSREKGVRKGSAKDAGAAAKASASPMRKSKPASKAGRSSRR